MYHVQLLSIFHPLPPFARTLRPAARMPALSEGASTPQHQGGSWIPPQTNSCRVLFRICSMEYCESLLDSYTKHIKGYQQNYRMFLKLHWTQRREVRKGRILSPSPSLLPSFDLQTIFNTFDQAEEVMSCLMASKISMACCHLRSLAKTHKPSCHCELYMLSLNCVSPLLAK